MPIIEVKNIRKEFKIPKKKENLSKFKQKLGIFYREWEKKIAVDDISFEIEQGEFVGYIGANGAGKSTTIKMLTGILTPNSGTIKIMNYEPSKDRIKYTQNIGVVFGQRKNLIYDIPIKDSYGIFRTIYDIPKDVFKERLNNLVKTMEIENIMEVPYRKLSLGEQMRAEIVSCFLHNPKIVFLDEPTIGLDVYAKHKIREFLKKINKEDNVTIILTTHDTLDIEELAKRIILIDEGKKMFDGTLNEFKKINSSKKKIEVFCKEKPIDFLNKNSFISAWDDNELKLTINIEKTNNFKDIIIKIIEEIDFIDIKIEDESLEEMIKRIYKKE
ncbi:MAG: ATP-binding cassette domain-containing protein [Candidatus Nanoarchaeia archaeon]|nr:ATP-binding cassette domain-containing protein [Candidatus Nanoarchaeia archaeon]